MTDLPNWPPGSGPITKAEVEALIAASSPGAEKVGTASIQNLAVTAGKIANRTITEGQIALEGITRAVIQAGAIGTEQIANQAVNTNQLTSLGVTTAKLAEGAVSAIKLGTEAVGTAALANLGVTAAKIAEGAVSAIKLAGEAVEESKIKNLAVTAAKIAEGTITETKLATAVKNFLLNPETPGALTERAAATEFEPSATKATLVTGFMEGASVTRDAITITNNGVVILQMNDSVAATGTSAIPFSFIVAPGKKWKWTSVEGAPVVKTSYTVL